MKTTHTTVFGEGCSPRRTMRGLVFALPFVLLGGMTAGCGGSSSSAPATQTTNLSGSVVSAAGTGLAGYTVIYDQGSSLHPAPTIKTTTNSGGQYAFSIPNQFISGMDTVSVYDLSGSLVATAPVVPGGASAAVTVHPPVVPAPPGP